MKSNDFGALIITHYERLLDYIKADYVHILMNGKVVKDGGLELMERVDKEGYDWIKDELGILDEEDQPNITSNVLGVCGAKELTKKAGE